MAKNDEQKEQVLNVQETAAEPTPDEEVTGAGATNGDADTDEEKPKKKRKRKESALQKIKDNAKEGDDAPSASLRFRDIVGGDYLWMLVRNQIWLIILVVVLVTAYIAVRYQCQQDVIDISQLERQLVESKFKAMSSSSNLTRLCRKSNVQSLLKQSGVTTLDESQHPPYIIEVPQE